MAVVKMISIIVLWCGIAIAYAELLNKSREVGRGGAWLSVGAGDALQDGAGVDVEVRNCGSDVAVDVEVSLSGAADGSLQTFRHDAIGSGKDVSFRAAVGFDRLGVVIEFRGRMGKRYRSRRGLVRDGAGAYHLVDGHDLISRWLRSGWRDRRARSGL